MNQLRYRLALGFVLITSAVVFITGIQWGLPTRATDQFLLCQPRYADRIELLTAQVPEVDSTHAADIVAPSGPTNQIVPRNVTETQKAQILCRYRLYSFQPDEMITFRSLSQMKPASGDFDPRLYQYGGLWIYGTGAIIEVGRLFGLVDVTDRATYIGNPELFGKFYIAARAYSAAWGVVGAWAIFALTRRITRDRLLVPMLTALCFVAMPVVIIMAHEAKPHLAGMVLILLTVLAADNYVRLQRTKWLWITGLLCGAAAGMVLWGAVGIMVIAAMAIVSRRPSAFFIASIAAIIVYAATNPYVVYHLFHDHTVLAENLGNTSAMYHFGRPDLAILRAAQLSITGASPVVFVTGLIGLAIGLKRAPAPSAPSPGTPGEGWGEGFPPPHISPLATLLAVVAIAAAIPFAAMAAQKPGEYGRFALFPDVALLIAASSALASLRRGKVLMLALFFLTAVFGQVSLSGFIRDSASPQSTSRWNTAVELQSLLDTRTADYRHLHRMGQSTPFLPTLGLFADPAPYGLPPVDLNGWRIVRLPRDYDTTTGPAVADVIVRPAEGPWLSTAHNPISWADKRFEIIERSTTDRLAYENAKPER